MIDPRMLLDEPSPVAVAGDDPFQGYDFVVGGIWVTYLPSRESPQAVISESFERQLDGRFLVAVMSQVTLPTAAAKITYGYVGVDAEGAMFMRNFATDGSFTEAHQIGGTPGRDWIFAGHTAGETGVPWQNTLTKAGADEIEVEIVFDPPNGTHRRFTWERYRNLPQAD